MKCNYAHFERVSDVTLADYSGDDKSYWEKKYGVSFVFINTQKGIKLIDDCKKELF